MTLVDDTNYEILLSQHVGDLEGYGFLHVDADGDSSFNPSHWVYIHLNDCDHDCEQIKLTHEEAGLLHDRLGLILGRSGTTVAERIDSLARDVAEVNLGMATHTALAKYLVEKGWHRG